MSQCMDSQSFCLEVLLNSDCFIILEIKNKVIVSYEH